MLIKISSSVIAQKEITFEKGLNVVLGDKFSTNSIGKSTCLLLVDFAMGGDSYPKLATAIIQKVGHHSIGFTFEFEGQTFHFVRFTNSYDVIHEADENYLVKEKLSHKQFTNWLKSNYGLAKLPGSWRSLVSLYSRIWGKNNYDVDKPLRGYISDSDDTSISQLIKLFNFYYRIESAELSLSEANKNKQALNLAFNREIIKKINKKEYEANQIVVENLEEEISEIKNNLLKFAVNIEELYSRELIELKEQKRLYLEEKYLILNRRKRLEISLSDKMRVDNRQFDRLKLFFDDVNVEKLRDIESFHVKISKLLRKQIEASMKDLDLSLTIIDKEISVVDVEIDKLLEGVSSPKIIVDRIFDLSRKSAKLKQENKYYDDKKNTLSEINTVKESLSSVMEEILDTIEKLINTHMSTLNEDVYSENRKSPYVVLRPKAYRFDHAGNTGTGKSYIDLILFDLSILELSLLPCLIHDSFLFKNIEDSSVSNIFSRYDATQKQVFISIDGIEKYSSVAQKIILNNKRIELSDDNLLFGVDLR